MFWKPLTYLRVSKAVWSTKIINSKIEDDKWIIGVNTIAGLKMLEKNTY